MRRAGERESRDTDAYGCMKEARKSYLEISKQTRGKEATVPCPQNDFIREDDGSKNNTLVEYS